MCSSPAAGSSSASTAVSSAASTWADDVYEPKRFFSYLSDDALLGAVARVFDVVEFHTVDVDGLEPGAHFQAFILRRA